MWLVALSTILAAAYGGATFYRSEIRHLRQHVASELKAINSLKIAQLAAWRTERRGDAGVLTDSPFLAQAVTRWRANPGPALANDLLLRFRSVQRRYGYHDVLLVDRAGRIDLSLTGTTGIAIEDRGALLTAALHLRQPILSEIHTDQPYPFPHLSVIAPLFRNGSPDAEPLGAVILVSDVRESLYPLLQSWPTFSASGEVLLVRRDGDELLGLNELRHQPGTALRLRLPLSRTDVPGVRAVLGETGLIEGPDYRGVEVVTVAQPVPDSPWVLVAKVDSSEAFAAGRQRAILLLSLVLSGAGLLLGLTLSFWQRRTKMHYRALYESEAARRTSEDRYALANRATFDVIWDWELAANTLWWTGAVESLFGYTPEELEPGIESWTRRIHPEDLARVEAGLQAAIDSGAEVWSDHYRFRRKDGRYADVEDRCVISRDASGKPVRMVGALQDITERTQHEQGLRDSEARFRNLFEQAVDGIFLLTADHRFLDANPAALALLGYERDELMRLRLPAVLAKHERPRLDREVPVGMDPPAQGRFGLPGGSGRARAEQRSLFRDRARPDRKQGGRTSAAEQPGGACEHPRLGAAVDFLEGSRRALPGLQSAVRANSRRRESGTNRRQNGFRSAVAARRNRGLPGR